LDKAATVEKSVNLMHNRAFLRLWIAQVVSNAGTQITTVALPLTAVVVLGATPTQMGILGIASYLPNLLFGLFAGVWIDRTQPRPILMGSDLGRAVLLGSIPAAALLGHLTLMHLWVVAFAAGILTVFFQIASVAALPSLVRLEQLVEANGRLALSESLVAIAGPSAAGGLVQLVGAPRAIIADALSYLLSALSLRGVRASQVPHHAQQHRGIWAEIGAGLHALVSTPLLRALALTSGIGTLSVAVQNTVLILFLVRNLGLPSAIIGLAFACNGGGSLLGAVSAGWVARRIGTGRAIIFGQGFWTIGGLLVPFAGLTGTNILFVLVGQVIAGFGMTLYTVNQTSLRQRLTPTALLGRVTAARRFLVFSMAPAGAALAGFLGGAIGLRPTLLVGAAISLLAVLLVALSPVRLIRD